MTGRGALTDAEDGEAGSLRDGGQAAVVFGGSGFIGRRLCRELTSRGFRAIAADVAGGEGPEFRRADVSRLRDVIHVLDEFRPVFAINLAYLLGQATEADLYRSTEVNVLGMTNFFEGCRRIHVARCAYASSIAVYGDQSDWGDRAVTEADHGRPSILYGWQKQLNEATAARYQRDHGVRCIGLRISRVYGPDLAKGSASPITSLVESVARGQVARPSVEPDGASLIYVDDVAEAFAAVATAPEPRHDVYNTGGEFATMDALASMVRELVPEARIELGLTTERKAHVRRVDGSRLRDEFGLTWPTLRQHIAAWLRAERASGARSEATAR